MKRIFDGFGSLIQSIRGGKFLFHKKLKTSLLNGAHIFYRKYLKGTKLGGYLANKVIQLGLINITTLQLNALSQNKITSEKVGGAYIPAQVLGLGVPGYYLSPPLNFSFSPEKSLQPYLNVLLPSLNVSHMSGGPNTALILSALLAESGERIRLIATDAAADGDIKAIYDHMDKLMMRSVNRERIDLIDGFDRSQPTFIGVNDIFVATAWWTAQMVEHVMQNMTYKSFVYLIQDFEPILHEGSTFQARALETYGFEHIPVINTKLLLDHLSREAAGQYAAPTFLDRALWFEPALDRKYFFHDGGKNFRAGKKTLLFYARPTVARRNLFEMGVVALREAVASKVINASEWDIWAIGENIPTVDLGCGVFLNPLPWMGFEGYAKCIREADLMLSLMLSPHPSYPPIEMAASGNLIVTNSFSVKTKNRMQEISPNIIVAEPNARSIGDALKYAASRVNLGLQSFDPYGNIDLPKTWDESLAPVVEKLLPRLQELRNDSTGLAKVFHKNIDLLGGKTEYELLRIKNLELRRSLKLFKQEIGLISFVTSAYNTEPQYLTELAESLIFQDGGTNFEWLVLDNGSTDKNTQAALQDLARNKFVKLHRVEKNLGIVGGMRFCLEHASGKYILPLDSDDLIEPDCVNVVTEYLRRHNYPALMYTDEDKCGLGNYGTPYFKPDWDPVLFIHSCYIAHLCVINRVLANTLNLYTDKSAEGCHDWDSFFRFMRAGYEPIHIPEILYSWRIHEGSTSGNISSKNFIRESHRAVLGRFIEENNLENIELNNSPLFFYDVDWWFKNSRKKSLGMETLVFGDSGSRKIFNDLNVANKKTILSKYEFSDLKSLFEIIQNLRCDFIHITNPDVILEGEEWGWDSLALFDIFPDAVAVGGLLHDGQKIVDGPIVFGFGNGIECPDIGRSLSDPGYGAQMWKQRSVFAINPFHIVVRKDFILKILPDLIELEISYDELGLWVGGFAAESGNRIIYSPFMRSLSIKGVINVISNVAREIFLENFRHLILIKKYYPRQFGLNEATAYLPVSSSENSQHLQLLFKNLSLSYQDKLKINFNRRKRVYRRTENLPTVSIVTTVYEGTNLQYLKELAESIKSQTCKPTEWVIVAHGPIEKKVINFLQGACSNKWEAKLLVVDQPLGIAGAMKVALDRSSSKYIVPIDSDDLLSYDAIQVLCSRLETSDEPDLIYSDEDLIVNGIPASPYRRPKFDPIFNLDSSYIWHLCAIKRQVAIELNLYCDEGATWCHDWDTVFRMVEGGYRIEHIPEVLYHWRQHAGSTTNNKILSNEHSLKSVRNILDRQILRQLKPKHFFVDFWPISRGSPELYIARISEDMPQFLIPKDLKHSSQGDINGDTILVLADDGISIKSKQVYVEVARLFELHKNLGVVGGRVIDYKSGLTVDGCYQFNEFEGVESQWIGRPVDFSGPYSISQKVQTVDIPGSKLAFIRVDALKSIGRWPLIIDERNKNFIFKICSEIIAANWKIAFSPLVLGYTKNKY